MAVINLVKIKRTLESYNFDAQDKWHFCSELTDGLGGYMCDCDKSTWYTHLAGYDVGCAYQQDLLVAIEAMEYVLKIGSLLADEPSWRCGSRDLEDYRKVVFEIFWFIVFMAYSPIKNSKGIIIKIQI